MNRENDCYVLIIHSAGTCTWIFSCMDHALSDPFLSNSVINYKRHLIYETFSWKVLVSSCCHFSAAWPLFSCFLTTRRPYWYGNVCRWSVSFSSFLSTYKVRKIKITFHGEFLSLWYFAASEMVAWSGMNCSFSEWSPSPLDTFFTYRHSDSNRSTCPWESACFRSAHSRWVSGLIDYPAPIW